MLRKTEPVLTCKIHNENYISHSCILVSIIIWKLHLLLKQASTVSSLRVFEGYIKKVCKVMFLVIY